MAINASFEPGLSFQLGLLVIIVPIIAILTPYAFASSRPKGFPPGPPTKLFIGNLHLIPTTKSFLLFREWAKTYGSIIGLKFGPANVVILSNYKDVQELLEKRSSIYSSRPPNYIVNNIICPNDVHILFSPYGPGWKAQRKAVQALFVPRGISEMLPLQNAEATQTVYDLLCDPEGYFEHIKRYSTALILASVFGQRGETFYSEKVQALYDVQDRFTELIEPGATPPLDALPFLRYLPGFAASWRATARAIRRDQSSLYFKLFRETKIRMARGKGTGCFMEKLIQNQDKSGLDDEHLAYLGGILMEAGSDTTSLTLLSFLLGIMQNQNALRQAQEEVDRCCGTDRLPSPDDIGSLPYIRSCMLETLRWRPITAGGIPHMLTQTDTYGDYVFPVGTIFLTNTWAMHHDENEYTNPHEFNPNRWLHNKYGTTIDDSGRYDSEQRKATYTWGNGRRICSGQKLAENSMQIGIAKMVWAFDIDVPPERVNDVDDSPQTAFYGGIVLGPQRFPVRIRPRSEKHAEVVRREFGEMKPFLENFQVMS